METSSKSAIDVSSYLDIATPSVPIETTSKYEIPGVHNLKMDVKMDVSHSTGSASPPNIRSTAPSEANTKRDGGKGIVVVNMMNCVNDGGSTDAIARVQEQILAEFTAAEGANGVRLASQNGSIGRVSISHSNEGPASLATGLDKTGQPASDAGDSAPTDTPRGKSTNQKVKSAQKTPTFVNGGDGSPSKGRRRPPRRRREDTPHPASGISESTSTTPQTTPEKPSKPPRKRKVRRVNGEGAGTASNPEDATVGVESPLARKSTRKPRRRKNAAKENPQMEEENPSHSYAIVDAETAQESVKSEVVAVEEKLATPVDALSVEIEYPAFQTSAILEFEPDFPQPGSTQATTAVIESETTQVDDTEPKSKTEQRSTRRPRRFRRCVPIIKKQRPKRPVKEGTRPALQVLFERHGAEFSPSRRPYLQYRALEAAAFEKNPNLDLSNLHEQFRRAFQQDSNIAWTGDDLRFSSIDEYFARSEGHVSSFRYAPAAEATEEFIRLSLEAGWIKERPQQWDVNNWKESLKRYEKLWEGKEAKKQRRRFRNACFWEFDQVSRSSIPKLIKQYLGRIFFNLKSMLGVGHNQVSEENETPEKIASHEAELQQRLKDCRHFLNHFGEFTSASLEDCQKFIDRELNVNLYDLLNWLRNPDTATQPDRFPSVKDLGKYSYEENKVFPRFRDKESDIASPLLRGIGEFAGYRRGGPRVSKTKADAERKARKVLGFPEESAVVTVSADKAFDGDTSSSTTDTEITNAAGASLFNLPESTEQAPAAKTNPFARKRRGAISHRCPPTDTAVPSAGNTVQVTA